MLVLIESDVPINTRLTRWAENFVELALFDDKNLVYSASTVAAAALLRALQVQSLESSGFNVTDQVVKKLCQLSNANESELLACNKLIDDYSTAVLLSSDL